MDDFVSVIGGPAVSPSSGCARGAAAPSPTAIRAITVPTSTVSPTGTMISATTPDAGDGTSVSILSVEISTIVASASIRSPGSTRQATTVPSATDTPIWGIVTSTRTSVGEELTARLPHSIDSGQHRLLERRRERDRNVGRRHPDDRAVQRLEPLLGDQCCHLSAGGARGVRLVDDHHLRAALHRVEDRLLVERDQRPEIQHLYRRPVEPVRDRLQRDWHHRAVRDHHQIRSALRDTRGERSLEDARGHVALDPPVQVLVLHITDRVRVADG